MEWVGKGSSPYRVREYCIMLLYALPLFPFIPSLLFLFSLSTSVLVVPYPMYLTLLFSLYFSPSFTSPSFLSLDFYLSSDLFGRLHELRPQPGSASSHSHRDNHF